VWALHFPAGDVNLFLAGGRIQRMVFAAGLVNDPAFQHLSPSTSSSSSSSSSAPKSSSSSSTSSPFSDQDLAQPRELVIDLHHVDMVMPPAGYEQELTQQQHQQRQHFAESTRKSHAFGQTHQHHPHEANRLNHAKRSWRDAENIVALKPHLDVDELALKRPCKETGLSGTHYVSIRTHS
jgi:hypothetical protein